LGPLFSKVNRLLQWVARVGVLVLIATLRSVQMDEVR
jgi:hypothetical protein